MSNYAAETDISDRVRRAVQDYEAIRTNKMQAG